MRIEGDPEPRPGQVIRRCWTCGGSGVEGFTVYMTPAGDYQCEMCRCLAHERRTKKS